MNNQTLLVKIKQRLNKQSSNDYENIQPWQFIEAFNKGMVDWCRRNLHGTNIKGEGDEQSTSRIDDLQSLLVSLPIPQIADRKIFYETINDKPLDYLRYKRISAKATKECCSDPKSMKIYLAEEANVDILLADANKKPNFEWAETFATFIGNKIRVYTNGEFVITDLTLIYYRQPRRIQMLGVRDPYTGNISTVNVECEFNDDLVELFAAAAADIIAGDIESLNQAALNKQNVENNN
jgi:hypothetical protein